VVLRTFWLGLALVLAAPAGAEEDLVDAVVAQVGSDIVLLSEVDGLAGPVEARMREAGAPDEEVQKLRADVLERLIERRLIQQVVRRAELEATDAEIDAAIATIARDNDLSPEALVRSVEAQGLTYPAYRERIKGEIEQAKVLNGMVRSRVRVDDREVRALYDERFAEQPSGGEEVHLRHLLITFQGEGEPARKEACAKAEKARQRVLAGERFADVATELSESNPEQGGDIGWLHVESLASWMAPAVSGLEPGQVTGVLPTSFGCNLLYVDERREYQPLSFDQAKQALWAELFDQRTAEEYAKWIEKIRQQTYIERKGVFAEARRPVPKKEFSEGP
jgi:peptidyl-prolyl cis-trans isomerase SurA